jgi:hypothetical protein
MRAAPSCADLPTQWRGRARTLGGSPRFNAGRGGHAPGHLREAFWEWAEADQAVTVTVDETERPVAWLFGQLWNCSDVMPGAGCDDLDLPRGSTYAQAVRRLKVERGAAR